jgi:preprotein translocase subunit SecD
MSLKIEICVPFDERDPAAFVAKMLAAIGYRPYLGTDALYSRIDGAKLAEMRMTMTEAVATEQQEDHIERGVASNTVVEGSIGATAEEIAGTKADDKPVRERGKPSPGAKRRTKEEVAEDLAAEKAELEAASTGQGISSGENRVNPEDSEADQAQDAEDEAAEVEAKRTEPLTLDDVKNAAMSYAQTFGMPATQEDGQKIMAKAFGEPPAGEKGWTIPMLKTVEQFETAIKYWEAAVSDNPFKRTPV